MYSIVLPLFISFSSLVNALSATHDYSQTHSVNIDPRDGWETIIIGRDSAFKPTNVSSISPHSQDMGPSRLRVKRGRGYAVVDKRGKKSTKAASKGSKGIIGGVVGSALKGIGEAVKVKITWYSGRDLLNPSCWPNTKWAPSDDAFACALTLQGWTTRPKCFSFLELCNGPSKCIFVRVIDTCAGCAPGSKHVDLTKAAFSKLAPLDQGTLQVQMRLATNPAAWRNDLWGPKA